MLLAITTMPPRTLLLRAAQRSQSALRRSSNPCHSSRTLIRDNQPTCAHQCNPHQGNPSTTRVINPSPQHYKNLKEKANINIASLNMNGATAPSEHMNCIDKGAFGNVFTMRDTSQIFSMLKYDFVRKNVLFGNRYSRVKTFFGS